MVALSNHIDVDSSLARNADLSVAVGGEFESRGELMFFQTFSPMSAIHLELDVAPVEQQCMSMLPAQIVYVCRQDYHRHRGCVVVVV